MVAGCKIDGKGEEACISGVKYGTAVVGSGGKCDRVDEEACTSGWVVVVEVTIEMKKGCQV